MNKLCALTFALSLLIGVPNSYGFGSKKMNVSSLNGITETQVAQNEAKASVLVRGKAAELIFRMMREQQAEQKDTEALQLVGGESAQWTAQGKQISCSKIQKKKQADYACAFELDKEGSVLAGLEPYSPGVFNLAKTSTGSKLFKNGKKAGRSLASVSPAAPAKYSKGDAYVMYDEPGKRRNSKDALIVFRGASARGIIGFLENSKEVKTFTYGGAKGIKGHEIACVEKTDMEAERCSLVVSFHDGSISRSKNPLFR